jgi:hypothetical protein
MADRVEHLPDLPVASLANGDAQRRLSPWLSGRRKHFDLRRLRAPAVDRHAPRQAFDIVEIWRAEHPHFVDARHPVTGMGELRRQFAVVGQQEEPLRLEIESADRVDVFPDAAQQIHHRLTTVGVRTGGDVAARLVQQHVAVTLRQLDTAAIDPDVVRDIRLRPQLPHGRAVDGDPALEDQLLRGAARGDAGL